MDFGRLDSEIRNNFQGCFACHPAGKRRVEESGLSAWQGRPLRAVQRASRNAEQMPKPSRPAAWQGRSLRAVQRMSRNAEQMKRQHVFPFIGSFSPPAPDGSERPSLPSRLRGGRVAGSAALRLFLIRSEQAAGDHVAPVRVARPANRPPPEILRFSPFRHSSLTVSLRIQNPASRPGSFSSSATANGQLQTANNLRPSTPIHPRVVVRTSALQHPIGEKLRLLDATSISES